MMNWSRTAVTNTEARLVKDLANLGFIVQERACSRHLSRLIKVIDEGFLNPCIRVALRTD